MESKRNQEIFAQRRGPKAHHSIFALLKSLPPIQLLPEKKTSGAEEENEKPSEKSSEKQPPLFASRLGKKANTLNALLRLLMRSTLHHKHAEYFHQLGGIAPLLRSCRRNLFSCRLIFVMIILRHGIETKQLLSHLMMTQEILGSFLGQSSNPSPSLEIKQFIRSHAHLVCRHPEIFLDAISASLKLNRPNGRQLHWRGLRTEEELLKEKKERDQEKEKRK